jgi:hypothetical protein
MDLAPFSLVPLAERFAGGDLNTTKALHRHAEFVADVIVGGIEANAVEGGRTQDVPMTGVTFAGDIQMDVRVALLPRGAGEIDRVLIHEVARRRITTAT